MATRPHHGVVTMQGFDILAVFGCGQSRVELVRHHTDDEIALYEVLVGKRPLVAVSTEAWQRPGIVMVADYLILWAGVVLRAAPMRTGEISACETSEEIVDVGYVRQHWCIVTELGVELRTPDLTAIVARYCHHEIVVEVQWHHDAVVVTDLEGRSVRLSLPELMPVL